MSKHDIIFLNQHLFQLSPCNHPTTSSGICRLCARDGNQSKQNIQVGFGDQSGNIPSTNKSDVDDDDDDNDDDNNVVSDQDVNDKEPELHIVEPPDNMYFVLELKQSRSFHQRNAAHEMTYQVKLKNEHPDLYLNNLVPNLQALFDTLIEHTRREYGEEGVARVYIDHPKLESAIIIRPTYLGELSSSFIIEVVERVLQSSGKIPADQDLSINIAVIKLIKGKGRRGILNVEEDTLAKRCFITIRNTKDEYCLPRAIVVAIAHHKFKQNPLDPYLRKNYDRIRRSSGKYQLTEAISLMKLACVPYNRAGLLTDVPKYEEILKTSICVISSAVGNKKVYSGSDKYRDKIFIYHYKSKDAIDGHFAVITKVNALLRKNYYCEVCDKGFNNNTSHKCKLWCDVCGRSHCPKGLTRTCPDCNQICRSNICYEEHKKEKKVKAGKEKGRLIKSKCEQFWQCPLCGVKLKVSLRSREQHMCGEIKCQSCQEYHLAEDHKCYMRSLSVEKKIDKFIFFDFECYVNEKNVHVPNLVVSHTVCKKCENLDIDPESRCDECGSRCSICCVTSGKEKEYERKPCLGCGKREIVFKGERTNENFCKWLINKQHKNTTVIAHNAKAYDTYFIYEHCLANGINPEPIIFSGSKIMYMKVGEGLNMRFIDSVNFLPMPLASLPKSFDLQEMKKGYFPHLFNLPCNQNVILPRLPEEKFYDPDSMNSDKRKIFKEWYMKNVECEFNFEREIYEYCVSDVSILRKACLKFRNLVKKITGTESTCYNPDLMDYETVQFGMIDPFGFLTIASVCLGIFRAKYLKERWSILTAEESIKNPTCSHEWDCVCKWIEGRKLSADSELEVLINGKWVDVKQVHTLKCKFMSSPIAVLSSNNFGKGINHSKESIEWLMYLEDSYKKRNIDIHIQHARSSMGERKILYQVGRRNVVYHVDGYFELDGEKYVCEYYGCNWHGCPKCYVRDRESTTNNGKSLGQRYRETMLKESRLREMGYIVKCIWKCEFDAIRKEEAAVREFITSLNICEPINIRDCYFGGRTNALTLYKRMEKDEKGYYVDFCSLYPSVLKYNKFPVGHPEHIIKDFKGISFEPCEGNCDYENCTGQHKKLPYFGVIKATLLPPRKLLHPVLPVRINDKLKFPLCMKCAVEEKNITCKCNLSDRYITYTYCTNEVEVALNMGYELIEIFEVLHWSEFDVYDTVNNTGGLFTEYINCFLKIKQESSGYPADIQSDIQKKQYIEKYNEMEGIYMDEKNIVSNPGLRGVSKLALNSFYGKFGQRTNLKKTKLISDINVLYETLTDQTKLLSDFHIINENYIEVEFQTSPEFENMSLTTNVILAAFCTSWARLKLWFLMNKLGSRVLYHDTDSVIFTSKTGDYVPPTGNYLGDLTDELSCKEMKCKLDSKCKGHWIEEFVSCGPKNYAYKLNTGETVCKVRGFSLNHQNSQIINFETMKETLFDWMNEEKSEKLITVKTEIARNKHEQIVYNRVVEKRYGIVYDKRRVLSDYTTLPYGY